MKQMVPIWAFALLLSSLPAWAQSYRSAHRSSVAATSHVVSSERAGELMAEYRLEFARGTYRLMQDATAFSRPSPTSRPITQLRAGNLVKVTGATLDFVRVVLSDGEVGYVPSAAVTLFRPGHRNYWVTRDSPVYARPNLASQQVATVHQGHNAHVIGVELNYLKIRMRSGLEGFVPVSAVE